MANNIYLTLTGNQQGKISAECGTVDPIGNKYQIGHKDQIFVLQFDHSISRNQNINHQPITFFKPIDKSSPLLGNAISNNEKLELLFDFYRTAQTGTQEKYYSVKLIGAVIRNITVSYPHALTHAENQPEEMISVAYQSIDWQHHIAGTGGYSLWEEQVY
ncbi:Hcp family type VI secretion system effector [Pectobacterium brasiliense]|uniref:Hcp family type VI secretion system effector n=1 Tax=Pectobacterium brasiliense TaxID=180957 RepID=UPI002A81C55A|nr:Hcp family type VI secretion system effector [Pectobacterium brasiliense]MDY4323481.1 Hcp family type VI secretion system effector [Pectobacterium brasiliense]